MVRSALKILAYSKAPRATFTIIHPKQTVQMKKAVWDFKHAYAPRMAAIGAAALALPIGMMLGRMGRDGGEVQH